MKNTVWIIIALVLVGGGITLFLANDQGQDAPQVTATSPEMRTGNPPAQAVTVDKGSAVLPDSNAEQPEESEAPAVTQEQMTIAQQQEAAILDLAREYDSSRDDPQKKQAVREEMTQALANYRETILPIAMEKMESARSPN